MLKEPATNEYYLDFFVFADVPLFTSYKRTAAANWGGSGILPPQRANNFFVAKRAIILGRNIPTYDEEAGQSVKHGESWRATRLAR